MNPPSHETQSLPSAAAAAAASRSEWPKWTPSLCLLGLFWLLIFNQQRLEWSVNVVYSYGWAVPFLALYLLWERWGRRPVTRGPLSFRTVIVVAVVLLAAYLPVRVIQEANPDWVKINWLMAGLCAGLTLLVFAAIGGLRYSAYFAFPILFGFFSALPWPVWMETYLIQELMRFNASVCAEILTFFGTPAIAEGNLIQIANHWVNVEEACSGIRSLQTAFMVALFLGELHRLSLLRRFGLLLASFGAAFFVNLVRTLILTYVTGSGRSIEAWHDPVGIAAMFLCLALLWALSEWFRRGLTLFPEGTPTPLTQARMPWPGWFAIAGCVWLVGCEAATSFWYRYHESQLPPVVDWHIKWPETAPNFRRGEFNERTLALLKFNSGETADWTVDVGYPWQMYALSWLPGRVSKFLSISHYPTVCLPATGLKLVSEMGVWDCPTGAIRLPFATYLFEQSGQDVYVFHAIIEDRPLRPGEHLTYRQVDSSERLRSVWNGERNLGQHVIGIAIRGPASPTEARNVVERVMRSVIQLGPERKLAANVNPNPS